MIRTGTLVVVWTLAALLAESSVLSAAENLPSLARRDAASQGWTTSGETSSDAVNPFRNSATAAAAWQPMREEPVESIRVPKRAKPAPAPAPVKSPAKVAAKPAIKPAAKQVAKPIAKQDPTHWIEPTQTGAAAVNTNNGARAPKAFAAPSNAERMAKSPVQGEQSAPSRKAVKAVARDTEAKPQAARDSAASGNRGNNLYSGSAAQYTAPPKANESKNSPPQNAPRNNAHHASRPSRPAASGPRGLFDGEGWIRPLQQVAYQVSGAAEEEEMPAPPGQRSVMSRNHSSGPSMMSNGPMMGSGSQMPGGYYQEGDQPYMDPGMPDGGYGEGWIGPPSGSCGPDGCCGSDTCCGPMCGDACEPGCGCSDDCPDDLCMIGVGDDESCHTVRVRVPRFQEVMINAGVHGFKGPFDQFRDSGNFGFQEGINVGAKLPFTDWGYQVGYQATQSQLNGDIDTNIASPFHQNFVTAGAFHRTRDGIQGGFVWDMLLDDRDRWTDFYQLRGEISFVDCGCHEFGFMGAWHLSESVLFTQDDDDVDVQGWQSVDQYLLFYRMHGRNGGEGRFFGGVSDNSDGIVGADFLLPLKDCWSLQTGFTYLIPDAQAGTEGARQEGWNLGINLVWHWKGHARECHSNPYRPLFNVADNGSMIIDDRP